MKLNDIYQPILEDLAQSRKRLHDSLAAVGRKAGIGGHDRFINKAINHLFTAPGKGLRPALVLFSAKATSNFVENRMDAILQLAVVVELIHSASLIHDDIIDEAEHRRKLVTVHRKFGPKTAILVGDILYAHAFSLVEGLPSIEEREKLRLYAIFSDLTMKMCYGEIFEQQVIEKSKDIGLDDYLRILEWKTARLMSVCCMVGSVAAAGSEEQIKSFEQFGLDFGFAYQLADDLLDQDSICTDDINLGALTKKFTDKSQNDLSNLLDSKYRRGLISLSEFVLNGNYPHG